MRLPFAYLDASSVSMAISAIAGGAAGIAVVARVSLRRFKNRILRRPDETPSAPVSDGE